MNWLCRIGWHNWKLLSSKWHVFTMAEGDYGTNELECRRCGKRHTQIYD